jgi:uncharacterized RDD family membrane protein YckC
MPPVSRTPALTPGQSAKSTAVVPLAPDAPPQPAGFVSRLVALLMDIVFVTVGALVFSALVSLILNFFGLSTEQTTFDDSTRNVLGILQVIILIVSALAVLFFVPGYFVIFWALTGATPGKQIMGLRVIRTQGQQVGWVRAIIRYIGYFISAIALFLGFLWVFIDGRRQGWHDKLADTLVVYQWDVPPDQ